MTSLKKAGKVVCIGRNYACVLLSVDPVHAFSSSHMHKLNTRPPYTHTNLSYAYIMHNRKANHCSR